jgi:carboxylesterase
LERQLLINNPVFILIHGFGGDISEVQSLAEYLVQLDYRVVCPKLKGHTGDKADLKRVTYQDWVNSVEEEILKFQKIDQVVLIGFSMGGLIAINLAYKFSISALITINTPIYYWDIKQIVFNIINDIKQGKFNHTKRYLDNSLGFPIEALINFRALLNKTKPVLGKINCPVFVLQGRDDDVVRHQSADYIYNNVASSIKQIKYYDHSGHTMLKSAAAAEAIFDIMAFLNEKL